MATEVLTEWTELKPLKNNAEELKILRKLLRLVSLRNNLFIP
jgi:hypothetical protein